MKPKNILCLETVVQSRLLPLMGNLLLLIFIGTVFITGCDVDIDREEDAEPPVIDALTVTPTSIRVHHIADVAAVLPPNEDADLQYQYKWSVTDGEIKNNGVWDLNCTSNTNTLDLTARATYIAPKSPGIYTITLKVCTRYAVAEKAVNVEVIDYIIESSPHVYWKGNGSKQSIIYRFDVEAIRRIPVLLRYKIQQDAGQPTATLSINIGERPVTSKPISIPKASLKADVIISKEVDITSHISYTGKYELSFTLKTTGNIMENTWLLKNIQIIGVEGSFLP